MFWQGHIDVRSSRPPVKADEVDRDKRRQSAEKQKSAKDSQMKEKKKKNLDRQSLEARRAKSRQRGEPEKNPPVRTTAMTIATTPRGWRLISTASLKVYLEATSTPRGQERQRRGQADLTAPALTPLPRPRQVRPSRTTNLPLHQRRVAGLSPRRRGR